MDTDGFGDLLHQAQQLTADMDTGVSMPRVERNLFQIKDAAVKMANKTPYVNADASDLKASMLLGSKGYEVQKMQQKLEGLNTAKTFDPLDPIRDTDIQSFLKNERENALLAVIEQTKKNTFEESCAHHWEGLERDWEKEKQKILSSLVDAAGESLDFMSDQERLLSTSISIQGRTTLNEVELAYSKQVYVYHDQVRHNGIRPRLVDLCVNAESKSNNVPIRDMWSLVQHMINIPQATSTDWAKTRSSPNMQAVLVKQALKYLHESYVKYIETIVESKMQLAQRGGKPGGFDLVRSFLKVKFDPTIFPNCEDGLVNGYPTWAMIFYCFRCGDNRAVRDVIENARQLLGDFPRFFEEYSKSDIRRLSSDSEREVRLQYHRTISSSPDPFKRAMYCLIGRCDAKEDHIEVATSVDDYIWLKLCHVTFEGDGVNIRDKFTLSQLQTLLIDEYGESHFRATEQPYLYFRILFVTVQFEAAIEFLSRIEKLRVYAVHVAMVLFEQNLLLMPASIQALLLTRDPQDTPPLRRLNFVRLLVMYTKKFEVTDPREALQYFYFLRKMKTPSGDNIFLSCVSELVLETREFDLLLGQLQVDGSRRPGAIDQFQVDHNDSQRIIEFVARTSEEKGQLEDAVKLYDLAKDAVKVIELLNKLISQVVSQPPAAQSLKDRVQQMAVSIAHRYRMQGLTGNPAVMQTFHLQLDLMTFFDLYHSGHLEQAYKTIQDLKFLPLMGESVEQSVKAFRDYTDEIRRNMPDILLATMSILVAQYRRNKGGQYFPTNITASGPDDGTKLSTKQAAQAITLFAGLIPYRMPGDTNARLVQMETLMN